MQMTARLQFQPLAQASSSFEALLHINLPSGFGLQDSRSKTRSMQCLATSKRSVARAASSPSRPTARLHGDLQRPPCTEEWRIRPVAQEVSILTSNRGKAGPAVTIRYM